MDIFPDSTRLRVSFAADAAGGRQPPRTRPVRPPRDLGPPEPSPLRPRVVEAVREYVRSGRYHPPAEDVADRLVALARARAPMPGASIEP